MKSKGWDIVVLSDPNYEHLVAELYWDGQCLLVLDREQGRDALGITISGGGDMRTVRIPLHDFVEQIELAAGNLKR